MSIQGTARTGFATSSDYGWCETDRRGKNPKKMRVRNMDGSTREDYFLNPKFRPYTENFFEHFSLPMPKDDMVYRGNSQDLLFLNDLGLVVRTGPIDVIDMIHPGVLQPLYWMPFDNTDHVIALYGGIQLSDHLHDRSLTKGFNAERHKLVEFMKRTGQSTIDSSVDQNFGYCDGTLVVLDTEEFFFGSKTRALTDYKYNAYRVYRDAELPRHLAIRQVMIEMYGGKPEFDKWIAAYDYHQSLRAQIHDALSEPDVGFRHEKLYDFYQMCRDSAKGTNSDLALYAPWSGKPEDNQSKFTRGQPQSPKHRGLAL